MPAMRDCLRSHTAALCSVLMLCLHTGEALSIRAGALPGVNIEGGQEIQNTHTQPGHKRQQRGWKRWSGPVNSASRSMNWSQALASPLEGQGSAWQQLSWRTELLVALVGTQTCYM